MGCSADGDDWRGDGVLLLRLLVWALCELPAPSSRTVQRHESLSVLCWVPSMSVSILICTSEMTSVLTFVRTGLYISGSGRCGESRCPNFCLGVEVCLCFSNSVASTRWLLQDEQHLSNTKCDNCIIATTVAIQYISCIFSLLAICIDGLQEAACILDWTADMLWCSMWCVL